MSRTAAVGYWKLTPLVVSAMAAVVIFRLHELYPPILFLRPALVLTFAGMLAIFVKTQGRVLEELTQNRILQLVLLQAFWAGLTIPTSVWRGGSFVAWQLMVINSIMVAAVLFVPPTLAGFAAIRRAFLVSAGVLSIALFTIGRMVADDRWSVSFSLDPNDLAAVLAMVAPIALGAAFVRRGTKYRVLYLAAFALYLAAIVRTGSRGGTLALLTGLLVYFVYQPGTRKFAFMAAAVPLLIGGWALGPQSYRDKLTALAGGESDYNQTDYGGRVQTWKRGMKYVARNPVFGVGIGNFQTQEGTEMKEAGISGSWTNAHNAYIQAAAELGIPGFLILAALCATAIRMAHGIAIGPDKDASLVAGMLGYMVAAFFLSHAYAYHLFGLLALIALRARVRERT